MALDYFDTTARLAQERGKGIEKGFETLGQGMMGAAQGMQTQDMLKKFGLIEDTPPTLEDYQKEFEKQTKTKITNVKGMQGKAVDPNTIQGVNAIFDFAGLKKPQSKGVTFNADKAAALGAVYKPDMFGGQVAFAPKKPEKTLMEQITEAKLAEKEGLDIKGGKVQTRGSSGGYGAAQLNYAIQNAKVLADAVQAGDYSAIAGLSKTSMAPIAVELRNRGESVDEAMLGYKAEQSAMGNAKIQDQKVNNAISAQTLLDSSFDEKTGEYKVPPSMHVELALSVARMLSQTGVVPYEMVQELRQTTAREGLAGAAIWLGFDPKEIGGSTQSVINLFAKTIEREGLASERMRDRYRKGGVSSFKEFKQTGKTLTDTAGLTSPKQTSGTDLSSLSDEELRKIAYGK